ncbi:MAG: prepilin peptidase [Alphaproteobacteria bacterium]
MSIWIPLQWLIAVGAGAMVGSFLNVVIHRLPILIGASEEEGGGAGEAARRLSLSWPSSHCPACRAPIRLRHNVPLLGYVLLGGRCADCRGAISPRYPLVEAAGAGVAALALWRFGPTVEAGLVATLLWGLICVAAIDLRHLLIPDVLSGAILWSGLCASALGWWPLPASDSALGAAFGYSGMYLLAETAAYLIGREAIGGGDGKLLAGLGAWVGWRAVPLIFFGACLTGTLVVVPLLILGRHRRGDPLPFGPFLALSGAGIVLLGAGNLSTNELAMSLSMLVNSVIENDILPFAK